MKLIATRVAAGMASAAVLIGSAVVVAPSASAASLPKSCNWEWAWPQKEETTTAINLRTGAGTKYTSLGILSKGVRFTEYCNKDFKWSYGTVTSGANKGKKGWVSSSYLEVA
ncbi:SH3 domain-containing protein [Streptomyces sp. NPDC058469]|uniref:SH3 domain-containing protein n=1 Tax=Streptomyces sp. NPDC058469 TaxID=3346514 RepID=UPI003651B1FA